MCLVVVVGTASTGAAAEPADAGFEINVVTLPSAEYGSMPEPISGPSANAVGDIVFVAPDARGGTMFVRNGFGFTTPLVSVGDHLGDGVVARLVTMPNSIDAFRQILFYAVLRDGRSGLFRAFPTPGPFSVSPAWGYRDRPVTFHLVGVGFVPGIQVRFGDRAAGFVTVISQSELTGTIAAGAPAGTVDITTGRPGGATRTLRAAFEFRDPPVSGCRGFWPDHRHPDVTMSSMISGWIVPWGILAMHSLGRRCRRRRRAARRSRTAREEHAQPRGETSDTRVKREMVLGSKAGVGVLSTLSLALPHRPPHA